MTQQLSLALAALADPTRRAILAMLLEDDMAVTDVAAPLPMSLAAVSKHLAVLVRAGLIVQERRGRITWCRLNPAALTGIAIWMQGFGQFDLPDLDAFERFLAVEGIATTPPLQPLSNQGDDDQNDDDDTDDVDDAVHAGRSFRFGAPDV